MDDNWIQIMYKYKEIKKTHLEISSLCQASCPMCARNYHGGLPNPNLPESNLSLELFKKAHTPELLERLESMSFCGNYGDPILNNDLIDMIRYVTQYNTTLHMDVHTNASARTEQWWKDLAKALPPNHILHFGIDGLEDTHALYRVGTSFDKIMDNAYAFIQAGGRARWNFITFQHNEHQLEQARKLASEMGFESFHEKQTARFIGSEVFYAVDKNNNVTHELHPPTERKIAFIDRKTVENYKQAIKSCEISCEVENTKSIFIDAQGHVWPCCFVAAVPYHYTKPDRLAWEFVQDSTQSLMKKIEAFGGLDGLDIRTHSIQEIVDSDVWQSMWDESFEDKSLPICARVCGKFPDTAMSQCRDQFLELDRF
jgi:MoaA/NifB/PqqE/SkfB family radical SAM enzyme